MKGAAKTPVLLDWIPDDDDNEKWREWVSKRIITGSKKWNISQTNAADPESVERMKAGLDPLVDTDKPLVTSTKRHYNLGWRRLMMVLSRKAKR